jgi:hypothetical protein
LRMRSNFKASSMLMPSGDLVSLAGDNILRRSLVCLLSLRALLVR